MTRIRDRAGAFVRARRWRLQKRISASGRFPATAGSYASPASEGCRSSNSQVQAAVVRETSRVTAWTSLRAGSGNLHAAAGIGSHWGRVTSTYRSPQHNRRVGGVRNSWHIRGRAIDIARRPGVTILRSLLPSATPAISWSNRWTRAITAISPLRSAVREHAWRPCPAKAGTDEMGRRHRFGGASPLT